MSRKIYCMGSLQNIPKIRTVASQLRCVGHEVFDDWTYAEQDIDRHWREYEESRGHTYLEALAAPAAQHAVKLDKQWLDWCDTGVLILPAGRSAHLECGYLLGQGKEAFILGSEELFKQRWDLMHLMATGIFDHIVPLIWRLK